VQQALFKSVEEDHIIVHDWNGKTESATDRLIALPFLLRRTPFDGEEYDEVIYRYLTHTRRLATQVDGENVFQEITDFFVEDDIIYYTLSPIGGTEVFIPAAAPLAGSVTARTADDRGAATVAAGHLFSIGSLVNVSWLTGGGVAQARRGMSVIFSGGITAATKADPCKITSVNHGLSTGDEVHIVGVGGMTELNGNTYTITHTSSNTFTLDGVDSTSFGTYTSGGTWSQVNLVVRIPYTGGTGNLLPSPATALTLTKVTELAFLEDNRCARAFIPRPTGGYGGFVFGGESDSDGALNANANFTINQWINRTPLLFPDRRDTGCFSVGLSAYISGGDTGSGDYVADFDQYKADIWTTRSPILIAKDHMAGAQVLNLGYIAGGDHTGDTAQDDTDEYSPLTDTWLVRTAMDLARSYLGGTALNGEFYIFGGNTESLAFPALVDDVDAFNTVANTWASKTPLLAVRHGLCVANVSTSKCQTMAGLNAAGNPLSTNDEYDADADTHTSKSGFTPARSFAVGFGLEGNAVIAGGRDGSLNALADTQYFDGSSWIAAAGIPEPARYFASGTSIE